MWARNGVLGVLGSIPRVEEGSRLFPSGACRRRQLCQVRWHPCLEQSSKARRNEAHSAYSDSTQLGARFGHLHIPTRPRSLPLPRWLVCRYEYVQAVYCMPLAARNTRTNYPRAPSAKNWLPSRLKATSRTALPVSCCKGKAEGRQWPQKFVALFIPVSLHQAHALCSLRVFVVALPSRGTCACPTDH